MPEPEEPGGEDPRERFENLILAYLEGELPEEDRGFLLEALERYPECRMALEESRALREALAKGLELPDPPADFAEEIRRRIGSG